MNVLSPLDEARNSIAQIWIARVFDAKTADRGGVVRRSIVSVEREVGRRAFLTEIKRRGFHCVECGGQFIVICNRGHMQVIC
jgi:hypothetical protein